MNQQLLTHAVRTWGRRVRHVWDRGYGGSPWIQAALAADVGFVVRWKKGNKLVNNWGDAAKAWEIARGKRSQRYRMLRDPQTKQLIKVASWRSP